MTEENSLVKSVLKGSIAEEAGIETGDLLLEINGFKIKDVFDYRFMAAEEELVLLVRKPDGEEWELEIEKDQYEDLGLEFHNPMLDEACSCTNKCVFCFIDQLPEGLRDTLYFKDDDSRLSFLSGNYVTLTNMKEEELDRIIRYRMSPINVSVHTTNPELREKMLNNRFAGKVLNSIKKLIEGGIEVNCQIVLCRGLNDRQELDRTLGDLTPLYPGVKSISVVPVGLTRYRDELFQLTPFDRQAAFDVVSQVEKWQELLYNRFSSRVVYLADEFYILSGMDIPAYEAYEDFPQIENGVGLISLFKQQFYEYMEELKASDKLRPAGERIVSIATGVSPAAYIRSMCSDLQKACPGNLKINVYEISNLFFGENVTVTGLLTGQDLIAGLLNEELGEELLISRSMLRASEEIFLDDYTVSQVSEKLNIKVTIVENDGRDFIKKIMSI